MVKNISAKAAVHPKSYDLLDIKDPEIGNSLTLKMLFALLKQEGFIDERWYREQREYLEEWHPNSLALLMKYREYDAIPDEAFGSLEPDCIADLNNAFIYHDRRFMINNGYEDLMQKTNIIKVLRKTLRALRLPVKSINCEEIAGTSYDLALTIVLENHTYTTSFVPRKNSWPPRVWKLMQKIMFEQYHLLSLHVPGKSMVFISPSLGQALEQTGFASIRK
ncbi:hypothetical protein ORJ04_06320 [Rheinheimera baltica]|uniref:Uncharacterized protein n=1 Tax=Rheinheimera baltica TaxID=67576 RepID=A0ABT9HWQ7_9GAMM|nr:hypothetical protein [Rheinheimera baltica]MDP5135563.1 hypothetical protein [Rheinheimera baltica]